MNAPKSTSLPHAVPTAEAEPQAFGHPDPDPVTRNVVVQCSGVPRESTAEIYDIAAEVIGDVLRVVHGELPIRSASNWILLRSALRVARAALRKSVSGDSRSS